MKKLLLTAFFTIIIFSPAYAQIDIGQNDVPKKEESEKKAAEPEVKLEDKKASGIFSFMNFSFFKKKEEAVAQPTVGSDGKTETFLEKTTREANEGDADSQLALGYMYLYGEGVDVDYKKSFKYYAMAASQNDKVALNNLGSLYFSGIGVKKNVEKATVLFKKSSDLGNTEASVNLAFIYLSGSGTFRDYNESIKLFTKAAENGNPTAQFMIGYAFYKGFVVHKDPRQAFALIKAAADAKYDDAQYITAIMYLNGHGVAKNYGNAVRYLTASAVQGSIDAMVELGNILALGVAYPQNIYRAHVLFTVAAVYNAPGAEEKRDILEKKLEIKQLLEAQAEAESFQAKPSELTVYIRQTFGPNIRGYIDEAMKSPPPAKTK